MTQWIAAITRGHNAGVCLLKDGEIVFAIEEERLSRQKYDGGPLACMYKILEYTDKLDFLVIAHTQPLQEAPRIDFTGDDLYTGLARKLGLINRDSKLIYDHPQVIDLSHVHHKLHAACAFYRSGFETATAVIIDGAGTFIPMKFKQGNEMTWELETIFECDYPADFKTKWKHQGGRGPWANGYLKDISTENEPNNKFDLIVDDTGGIVKTYEAVTQYCGWAPIEAGKTMGLFPYGKPNDKIPPLFDNLGRWPTSNRNIIIPTYPNGAEVNEERYEELTTDQNDYNSDLTLLQNRRDLAYAVQIETQQQALNLIRRAVEITGNKNVVLSGGYGLNCVANYWYLEQLKDEGINLYVEPISNDAGTAIGAALAIYHQTTGDTKTRDYARSLYLGPEYNYSVDQIENICAEYSAKVSQANNADVVDLLKNKNIVAIFQGRSENGPRALGNRSIIFDPTFEDGKDYVNKVKRREYFRPFAGSILYEHAKDWFDMRGLDETPHMMYAMNCQEGIAEKIPSIIHVDGTCRIQTVKKEDNQNYYKLIEEFYNQTGVPILFNTSFNLGGEPLVETLDDAVRTLANSDIEYLYLPENGMLITVENDV